MLVMYHHLVIAPSIVKGDIRGMEEIVRKPLLNHMLFVTRAHDKLVHTIVGIDFHDMP